MATIAPLSGKYYGTKIVLKNGESFHIWLQNNSLLSRVSEREIARGWSPDYGFDHVETEENYKIAKICAEALTERGY